MWLAGRLNSNSRQRFVHPCTCGAGMKRSEMVTHPLNCEMITHLHSGKIMSHPYNCKLVTRPKTMLNSPNESTQDLQTSLYLKSLPPGRTFKKLNYEVEISTW